MDSTANYEQKHRIELFIVLNYESFFLSEKNVPSHCILNENKFFWNIQKKRFIEYAGAMYNDAAYKF